MTIDRAVEAGEALADFRVEAVDDPEAALASLAEFGAKITETFNSQLSDLFGGPVLRALGSMIFLEAARAFDSLEDLDPVARLDVTICGAPHRRPGARIFWQLRTSTRIRSARTADCEHLIQQGWSFFNRSTHPPPVSFEQSRQKWNNEDILPCCFGKRRQAEELKGSSNSFVQTRASPSASETGKYFIVLTPLDVKVRALISFCDPKRKSKATEPMTLWPFHFKRWRSEDALKSPSGYRLELSETRQPQIKIRFQ
jgi:hypothetical protein